MLPARPRGEVAEMPDLVRGRDARAWTAMVNVASSVISGITITKILGVGVLAFTRSKVLSPPPNSPPPPPSKLFTQLN